MPFYGTVLGKQKITLCFASYPSRVGNWGVPQFALPIARRSWQTVCQNIPWPLCHFTLSISCFFFFFLQCPHLYICIVCMYIWLNCIYLYLNVYCQCLMLTVCTKGLRVTQFQFSVCMYCTCGRIDNKADLTWLVSLLNKPPQKTLEQSVSSIYCK